MTMTVNLQLSVLPQCMSHLLIRTMVNTVVIVVIIALFKFSEGKLSSYVVQHAFLHSVVTLCMQHHLSVTMVMYGW